MLTSKRLILLKILALVINLRWGCQSSFLLQLFLRILKAKKLLYIKNTENVVIDEVNGLISGFVCVVFFHIKDYRNIEN